jgi:hypothetical protein
MRVLLSSFASQIINLFGVISRTISWNSISDQQALNAILRRRFSYLVHSMTVLTGKAVLIVFTGKTGANCFEMRDIAVCCLIFVNYLADWSSSD